MRCDDVTRELSAPSGRLDPSALAAHLVACPTCASFAAGTSRLGRLWEATRPPAPPTGAFDALWARIEHDTVGARPAPSGRRRLPMRRALGAGAAIAASALVAVLAGHHPGAPEAGRAPRPAVITSRVEIDEGQIVVIPIDGRAGVVVVEPERPNSDEIAPDFDALNEFEAMAAL